jgi:hypothetical protein
MAHLQHKDSQQAPLDVEDDSVITHPQSIGWRIHQPPNLAKGILPEFAYPIEDSVCDDPIEFP